MEAYRLPPLSADLLLVHAPAFFEFRDRADIYFPFLGTSGDVPITPLYEYFPIGFKSLQRYLTERDVQVELLNLSTLFLRYRKLSLESVAQALDVRLIGIDLHWMVHVQGSLAVAQAIKQLRPEVPIIFGGISSTYYADELIRYPFVDMVMQGYDTHEPMAALMRCLRDGSSLERVPNLLWKSDGRVVHNDFSYKPDSWGCGINWEQMPEGPKLTTLPIREVLSTQNAGCAYNCGWCGGSREAFRRVFKKRRAMARRPPEQVQYEFDSLARMANVDKYHFYSVGSYNETRAGMLSFLDRVGEANLRSVSYEQFHLTSDEVLQRMVQANRRTVITLSPESHDPRVAKLAGRGVYSNEELEAWIDRALDIGLFQIDIWYFVGMPEQDEKSVMETVDYCQRLLEKWPRKRVNPMLCPMIPFLDPASTFFEHPDEHGYRVFYRTAEEHRRGMERASLINRINYETRWLSREELVTVGFRALRRLMAVKADLGKLLPQWVEDYNAKIDDALDFIATVHEVDCIADEKERARELEGLADDILRRNEMVLFSGVANQAFPLNREIGGRWFDESGWPLEVLDQVCLGESSE